MSAERDALLERMARAVHKHCRIDDELLITQALLTQPARMVAMLSTRGGEKFTDEQFAKFCLQCAKHVHEGGPT